MKKFFTASLIILGILAVLLIGGSLYVLGATGGTVLNTQKLRLETGRLSVFDGSGEEIDLGAVADTPFSEFPSHLPNAFVAVEDKRFYEHHGFDTKRIVKAVLKNLASFSFREGASTISQQLVKNTHLTSEKTISRKLKEMKLTRTLEKNFSKEEILALYLNSIYFGHSAFGISHASAFYFGKDPSELSPAESAMLAALVKSPNRYSPFKDPQKCLERRNFVLRLMKEQGYLDESEYAFGIAEPLPKEPSEEHGKSAYLSLVFSELSERFPEASTRELAGFRVYTALDPTLQTLLEGTEVESDAAMLVRDNQSGLIKAFHTTAGIIRRLPASTIKPLLVYAPAIEENLLSPATPISDARADFGGYSPDDAGGATGEYVSARYALAHSVNIPAVRILNSIGVLRAAEYLTKMNFPLDKDDYTLALALGGMREGFTLTELADGYSTLANGGMYQKSGVITKIVDENGNTVYSHPTNKTRIFSEETSFLVSDMLETAAREGTAKKLRSLPYFVAAKTGTNEGKGGNLDAYTVAYTTQDTVAVWLGNADNSPVAASGGGMPATIAKTILETLYKDSTPPRPSIPNSIVRRAYDAEEYAKNHKIILSDPLSPLLTDPEDYFKKDCLPKEVSSKFSNPTIQNPQIYCKNGAVSIVLCQTEYYDYLIKRECEGEIVTIYQGPYRKVVCDSSVVAGKNYAYIVTPLYKEHAGQPVRLPRIRIETSSSVPDDWWEE